jgi:MFS transporter, FHS family, glucose/mannose:H+ symporter
VSTASEVSFSRWAFAASLGVFLLIGALDAAYGPLLRTISLRFDVSLPTSGTVLSVYFAGALAGVVGALMCLRRLSGRRVLIGALVTLAFGCAGIAASRHWLAFLGFVLLTGTGFGALDFTLNRLLAATESRHRVARLNTVNAAFGAGAVAGPFVVSTLKGGTLTYGFAAAAALACLLAAGQRGVRAPAPPRPAGGRAPAGELAPAGDSTRSLEATLGRGTLARLGLVYLCYVGTEAGTAGWIVAHLSAVGYSARLATAVTSGFWLAMTVGRLCAAPLSNVVALRHIVLGATALLALSLAVASIPVLAPAAYVVAGLAAAPIFPTGLAWAAETWPGDHRTASWALTASMLGGVVGPAIIAGAVSATSVTIVPAALSTFAALTFVTLLSIRGRGHSPDTLPAHVPATEKQT